MSSNQPTRFGSLLRRYRERAGLTQERLAERAGLTANAIGALERGERRRPYPHTMRALADALGLSDDERATLTTTGPGHELAPAPAAGSTRSPDAPATETHLPPQLTSLVGRTTEVRIVEQLLLRADVRLLTLLGPGGVGKTRLAIEAAAASQEHFADGVVFVPLASLESPELVLPTIARVVGLQEIGGATSAQTLIRWLREREMLLILDNFEHMLAAARAIAELLLACARLTLLVTSREPLNIRGEQVYPVPPLACPRIDVDITVAELLQSDAVRLFVQRAQAVRPDFALANANGMAVARICARLNGLPLAIELAAARTMLFSPAALLARLEDQLQVLTGGARDLPARQQTMRATVAWSYDLLAPAEQRLFRWLGVFTGGAGLDAIEAVCGAHTAGDSLDLIASLVRKSLVQREEQDNQPRFGMLETIRAYALDQLRSHAEAEAAAEAHVQFFRALAQAAQPHLVREEQTIWCARLTHEIDNLRVAVRWLLDRGWWARSVELVWALWRFWWIRGMHREARQWMQHVLDQAPPDALTALQRAQAELTAGSMAWAEGDLDDAERLCENALARFDAQGDQRGAAITLMILGACAISRGTYQQTLDRLEQSAQLFRAIDEPWGEAFARSYPGLVQLASGAVSDALATYEDALLIARRSGDRIVTHQILLNMGQAIAIQGAHGRAAQAFSEGLRIAIELQDVANVGYFVKGIGELAALYADPQRGVRLLGAAEALLDAVGVPFHRYAPGHHWHTESLAQVRAVLGAESFEQAWGEGRALNIEQAQAEALELGRVLLQRLATPDLETLPS
jgi:predicted ATPase/DNA-binding XRE family transcriptional regulator